MNLTKTVIGDFRNIIKQPIVLEKLEKIKKKLSLPFIFKMIY